MIILKYKKELKGGIYNEILRRNITYKDKVQKVIVKNTKDFNLFENCKKYLTNPIKHEGYLSKENIDETFYVAGDDALSQFSMLNPPNMSCYAVLNNEKWRNLLRDDIYDRENDVKVQLWKYDPGILTTTKVVDKLSLALSYIDEFDERVEEALDEMLECREG